MQSRLQHVGRSRKLTLEALENRLLLTGTGDDYGDTPSTAFALTPNASGAASLSGQIGVSGDVDMFAVTMQGNGQLSAAMNAVSGKKVVDPLLTFYDSAGKQIAYNNDTAGSKNAALSISVQAGQKIFIGASGYRTTIGAYTLQVTVPVAPTQPAFLPGPSAYSAGTVVSGQIVSTGSGSVLVVLGTAGNDAITLSQSGNTITVVSDAGTQQFTPAGGGAFAGAAIYGFDGNDTLRETASLAAAMSTVVYAGAGTDAVYENGADKSFVYGQDGDDLLVAVGGGSDAVDGGLGFDSFWVDSSDCVLNVEAAETAGANVHKISAFVAPTTAPAPSLEIAGQDMLDPTAAYGYTNNFVNQPLWTDGPQFNDIRQGAAGDCYLLAALSSLAETDPNWIRQSVTGLGDGTYAVRFLKSGVENYYRIDAQLPTYGSSPAYANLTPSGELWVSLVEKAFAQFRSGLNSYASIDGGWMSEGYAAITGASYSSISTGTQTASTLAQNMANALAAGHAVAAGSSTGVAPIVGGHAYSVQSVQQIGGVWYVSVYNPWGVDGMAYDSNPNDGLLLLTIDQFQAAFVTVQICNA